MAVVRCALDCWVEQPSSLQATVVPLANKKEGFYIDIGLKFCFVFQERKVKLSASV